MSSLTFSSASRLWMSLAVLGFCLSSLPVVADDGWACVEEGGLRRGDSFLVCGVATDVDEAVARNRALLLAQQEFETLCQGAVGCEGRIARAESLTDSCHRLGDGGFRCYRGQRYNMAQAGPGLFRRTTPKFARKRYSDPARRYALGLAYYQQSYSASGGQAPAEVTNSIGGIAGFLSVALNHRFGINGTLYRLSDPSTAGHRRAGGDLDFVVGTNLNGRGLKAMVGLGGFLENWTIGNHTSDLSGGLLLLGVGWNTRLVTYDFIANIRQTRGYDEVAFGGDLVAGNSSATGVMFRLGLRL